MSNPRFLEKLTAGRRSKFLVIGVIVGYCCVYGAVRLLISPTMELDEAEQFLNGAVFTWGYSTQPPLYSWLIRGAALFLGVRLETLALVKYGILCLFYLSFYAVARSLWNAKEAFLITGSLLLFPLYAYEFNRDLSHTVLAALMASLTLLVYVKLLRRPQTLYYVLGGLCIGLGILAKYNFAFFLLVLLLASGSFPQGRRILYDRRLLLTVALCGAVLAPHLLWLVHEGFSPVRYALDQSRAGDLLTYPFATAAATVLLSYTGIGIFTAVFAGFFARSALRPSTPALPEAALFRRLALYGLAIPCIAALGLRTGHFAERWLAPVLFIVPLALFSLVRVEVNSRRSRLFGAICASIAVLVLAARAFVGFAPELSGKVERLHIPFKEVSLQLARAAQREGLDTLQGVALISDNEHIAANLMAWLPGMKFVPLHRPQPTISAIPAIAAIDLRHGGIVVWSVAKRGSGLPAEFAERFPDAVPLGPIEAPFLRAKTFPPYLLGAALVPRRSTQH